MSDENNDIFDMDDEIDFLEEEPEESSETDLPGWKILIVDDDKDIHFLTKLVLRDFQFEERNLTFISAYSGEEAKRMIKSNPDITLIILDVIMEDMNAGLEVARYIREDLKNYRVRIILRTGQPGQEPESGVVIKYDIDDYKTKTELSSQRLFTTVISALRAYRNINILEKCRANIREIAVNSDKFERSNSLTMLTSGMMTQFLSLYSFGEASLFLKGEKNSKNIGEVDFKILGATGEYDKFQGYMAKEILQEEELEALILAAINKQSNKTQERSIEYLEGEKNVYMYFIKFNNPLNNKREERLKAFTGNLVKIYE